MSAWRAFSPFIKAYRARLALLGILLVSSTLSEGAGIGLLLPLIGWIQQGEAFLAKVGWLSRAFAWLSIPLTPGTLMITVFGVIAATLLLKFAAFMASAKVYNPFMKDLRQAAFARAVDSHLFYFHATSSGTLAQVLENEVEYAGQAFNFAVVILANAVSLLVLSFLMLTLSWKLTAVIALLGTVRYAVSGLFITWVRRLGAEHGALKTALKSSVIAVHQGIEVVKAFASERFEKARFSTLAHRIEKNADGAALAASANTLAEGLLGDGLLCLVIYFAVTRLNTPGPVLLTFLVVVTRLIPKVSALNDARIRVAEYASRVCDLPRLLSGRLHPPLAWGLRRLPAFSKSLVLDKVSFRYPAGEGEALEGVTLEIPKGATVAIVGSSGAGKTTMARLLLRLFDPSSGRIAADGIPLPELAREDWARLVAVVAQDTFIFDDTLENNVKYGLADCPPEALALALKRARASEFVASLPEREKTQLGERGVRLSGGQRQRIAIARAFLRDAPILILDEATSAMDAETERLIQEAIAELAKDRTMIVIAHRFSTIKNADRIVVLERGRVAEAGTHEELHARQGPYRRFYDLQSLRRERLGDAV
ncbi:MAG: ABC transporter ATP-binding protein [Elusimicrobia bacterium]|nr:ABC transporter ATP-binding protein [Elusimicrobiota bacterium]